MVMGAMGKVVNGIQLRPGLTSPLCSLRARAACVHVCVCVLGPTLLWNPHQLPVILTSCWPHRVWLVDSEQRQVLRHLPPFVPTQSLLE